jgi:ribosome-binding factor A
MSKRLPRLNEQLKRELSELIRTQVRDPRVGVVTLTGVETAADLGSAKVYVRAVGGADVLAASLEGLEAAAPFLRSALGRSLRLRKIPELRFREDRSYEQARRIEEILTDVLPEAAGEGGAEEEPSQDAEDRPGGAAPDDGAGPDRP